MKKCFKSIATMMLALIVAFGMIAPMGSDAASKYVKSLTLSKTSVTVNAGKTAKVTATVKVSGSASKLVSVSSSSKAIATVSKGSVKSGKTTITISGKKKGTAYITVKTAGKNKSKKYISKKIKVNVNYASVTALKVPVTSKTLRNGETVSVKGTVSPSLANPGVTYSSSDTAVATVSTGGTVKAVSSGTATITVKTKGTTSSGSYVTKKVNITVCNFDSSDYSVEYGNKMTYVEFKINKETTSADELRSLGYTVVGDTASKNIECKTATYTFNCLPTTLDELKSISLATNMQPGQYGTYDCGMFGPMAAAICACATWETLPGQHMYDHPIYDYFDYLNGPDASNGLCSVSNADRSGIYYSMKATLEKGKCCYFNGATPENGYTPSQPLTFTLVEGPYILPAKNVVGVGNYPKRSMILISFAGDDSQRYCDVYHSSSGNWYLWDDTWKNLIAGIKDAQTQW